MKAAVYYETGAPEVLRYEDVADPTIDPSSVLVRVAAISIEGGDTLNRLGGVMAATPHIVGYQCAGTIEAVGDAVTDRSEGQQVVCSMAHGSHAELVSVPASLTWPVPDGLDLTLAACVPIAFGTADDCLFEFGRPAGRRDGAGPGRSGWRRHRRHPAGQAGRGNRAGHRLDRRQAGPPGAARDSTTASTTATRTSPMRPDGSPTGGASTWWSTRWAPPWPAASGRSPTGAASRSSATPAATASPSTCRRSWAATSRSTACSSAPSCSSARGRTPTSSASSTSSPPASCRWWWTASFPLAEAAAAHAYLEDRKAFGRVVLVP